MNYLTQRMNELFGYSKPVHVTRNNAATITYGVQDQICSHPTKASAMRAIKSFPHAEYLGMMYQSELREFIAEQNLIYRARGKA